MKLVLTLVLLFLHSIALAQNTSFVKVKNNQLLDGNDKPLFLKGVNLGGWLLWEEWMWGGGFRSETVMETRLKELLGEEKYFDFQKQYYSSFVTKKDIELLSKNNVNCVRLPFNYRIFREEHVDGFALVDSLVSWCKEYKIYVILDMHSAPGGQSPYFIADPQKTKLWDSETNKSETIQLWKQLADHYKNESIIAGYDLLNEPKTKSTQDLLNLCKELTTEIRKIDSNHLLIMEGNNLAHDFKGFPVLTDENQLYSFHYYAWFAEGKKKENIDKIIKGIPGDGPVWCGEWGEDQLLNLQEANGLLKAQPRVCGISFWSYKRVYTNNKKVPFCSVLPGKDWDKVLKWLTKHKVKPTHEETEKGINAFLNALKLENCTFNPEVKAAIL